MSMRFKPWPCACLLGLLATAPILPLQAGCEGRVFVDHNGNGRQDAGEPGLAGVAVSDGTRVVRTDADGRYRDLSPDALVFVVKPAGFSVPAADDGLPGFWQRGCGDFALRPARGSDELRVLVLADPQTASLEEVGFYQDSIIRQAAGESGIALGLTLGDISNDDLTLYPALNRATTSLGVPWLHAPGNHDLDLDADSDETSLTSFRSIYGPDTYAWEEAQANIIVLDNVVMQPGQRPNYIGGLREEQLAFVEAYLAGARRDRLLVIAAHIPWFTIPDNPYGEEIFHTRDRARLFALLREFPHVLLLTGHRHTQRHVFLGPESDWHGAAPLHEYNVGAACGAFWSGVADADGIPHATMTDGTPKGYATLVIDNAGGYSLAWHPVGLPADDPGVTAAMRLHAPRVLRRGAFPGAGVYANVFMGMDDTRVEYRIDGGQWRPMRKVYRPDPWLLAENARDDASPELRSRDRSVEATFSPHLWRGTLPTSLPEGEHSIEVRAFDRWQGEQRARTRYRLDVWN